MSSPLTPRVRGAYQAFTLIELLTVIAIIGILAGITFGVVRGVRERASISTARAELATFAATLDAYKRQYGDYPQVGASTQADPGSNPDINSITTASAQAKLFNALTGKLGPKMGAMNGKVFLTLTQFRLETSNLPDPGNETEVSNAILDPWNRRYLYHYKNHNPPGVWNLPSYILYSSGPDGLTGVTITNAGVETVNNAAHAADNIYVNR